MQGFLLYALFESFKRHIWPGVDPVAYNAISASLIFAPLVAIGDLTALRRSVLIGWTVATAMIAAVLAGYEAWRSLGSPQTFYNVNNGLTFMSPLFALIAAVLFIGSHLLEGSEIDRRIVAAYPNYFEPAWKNGVQIVLAVLFTSAFWGLLFLGAALFTLIHISLLSNVIKEPSFYWPATTAAFAAAVHLTDVRVGLVRGVRTVALTLLSWLTPLLALLAGGFVLMLPFTGLNPLWKTKAAATILLSAASWLVVLINAAYQDGVERPTVLLRWAVRAASVILIPLTALASIGVVLRVQQYGLTPERIIAAAWALIGVCYALGYAFAAARPGSWMKSLEHTNVVTAWVILILIAALFTPIADPARLSVAEQVYRLNVGQVKPDAFDYAFLRFRSARYGREALKRMAAQKRTAIDLDIATRAATALKRQNPWETAMAKPAVLAANLIVYPKGHALPEGFTTQDWTGASTFNPCFQGTLKSAMLILSISTAMQSRRS